MPIQYEDWISIAFEVAKAKGADFRTTQREIQQGKAPTSEAIRVFAAIWQDRKEESSRSRSAAIAVAREEINV